MNIVREGFFTYLGDIGVPGSGFTAFGGTHLAVLAALSVVAALMCAFYSRLDGRRRVIMMRTTALVILALEVIKQVSFPLIHKQYFIHELTLHLCGINIFVGLIHAFFPNKNTGEILYSLGLPGAFAALVFPNWTFYPVVNFYGLQSFIIHILQITFVLMPLLSGEFRPSARNLWRAGAFLMLIVPPIYLVNLKLGTNFFFVNAGSEGSPLEIFVSIFGNPWFILPYIGLVLMIWVLMYLPWEIARRRKSNTVEPMAMT